MRKIIDGVRYDTEKSTLIGEASEGDHGDFRYWSEELYVTPRSGKYFLAGEGGALSQWGKQTSQNERGGSEGIKPISREQAFEWAQNYLEAEDIEKYFSELIEDA